MTWSGHERPSGANNESRSHSKERGFQRNPATVGQPRPNHVTRRIARIASYPNDPGQLGQPAIPMIKQQPHIPVSGTKDINSIQLRSLPLSQIVFKLTSLQYNLVTQSTLLFAITRRDYSLLRTPALLLTQTPRLD